MVRPAVLSSILIGSLRSTASQNAVDVVPQNAGGVVPRWAPTNVQDLHREYGNIFKHGNRNAASHLWSSFLFERAEQLSAGTLELMFSGFCVVSGSPTRPGDYTRYRLRLPLVGGGTRLGYMYYCCWPCVCDTQDFIRADTRNVTLADGETRQYHFAVVGNPCDNPAALKEPFTQPFYSRGPTTLEREAAEVRCDANGRLIGAHLSDGGYPIIGMFFDAVDDTVPTDASSSSARQLTAAAANFVATPGRMRHAPDSVAFQDESEYGPSCADRARNGYNSGMGEIFRKVASISPVVIAPPPAALQQPPEACDAAATSHTSEA